MAQKKYYIKVRPTFGGEWNKSRSYEYWTTAYDSSTGNTYLSIRNVPANTELTDTTYWALFSQVDGRYASLVETATTAVNDAVSKAETATTAASNAATSANDAASAANKKTAEFETLVSDENTRATKAETDLSAKISAETTRAEAVEKANADAIASEAARAEKAEKSNSDAIAAETKRAKEAESATDDKVTAINNTIGSADYSALASTITEGLKILQTFKGTTDITDKAIPTASEMISLLQGIGEASKLGTSGFHNGIYRGKYLGSSVTSDQWAAIKAGTFLDLYIGDYWIINGITWQIAAFDYYLHAGDTECTVHHVVIVPGTCLYSAQFETSNTTKNGYYGSQLKQSGLDSALATAASAFGSDHILEHRNRFCNACNTDTGRPSADAWYSTKIDIMTEEMVYGTREFAAVNPGLSDVWNGFHNYNIDYAQLPLFALDRSKICNRSWYWLRNPVSPPYFANVNGHGYANSANASDSLGVRPSFAIYQA